jgi:hypothetical protein
MAGQGNAGHVGEGMHAGQIGNGDAGCVELGRGRHHPRAAVGPERVLLQRR